MDRIKNEKPEEVLNERQKIKPVKADLLSAVRESKGKFDMADFQASVVGLFDDILKQENQNLDGETMGKLARLRARVQIELNQF